MNYIYDIILNFNDSERIIEFYEWDYNDYIEHIKKIPVYRIDNKDMENILNNNIIINKDFLNNIKGKTISYKNKKDIKYGVLFTDLNKVIGVEFNNKGNIICKSSLLLDEEDDVIDECNDIDIINIKYKIINKYNINYYLTREDDFKKNYLIKEINNIYKIKDYDKLNYLYEEVYIKDKLNIKERYNKLINNLKDNYSSKFNNLFDIVRLSYSKK